MQPAHRPVTTYGPVEDGDAPVPGEGAAAVEPPAARGLGAAPRPGLEAAPERGHWGLVLIGASAVYLALKYDLAGVETAAPRTLWERWLAVARDHPLRSAAAAAAFVKACASFACSRSSA